MKWSCSAADRRLLSVRHWLCRVQQVQISCELQEMPVRQVRPHQMLLQNQEVGLQSMHIYALQRACDAEQNATCVCVGAGNGKLDQTTA